MTFNLLTDRVQLSRTRRHRIIFIQCSNNARIIFEEGFRKYAWGRQPELATLFFFCAPDYAENWHGFLWQSHGSRRFIYLATICRTDIALVSVTNPLGNYLLYVQAQLHAITFPGAWIWLDGIPSLMTDMTSQSCFNQKANSDLGCGFPTSYGVVGSNY